jgi:ABC-2 type transport system ATP-binding protein
MTRAAIRIQNLTREFVTRDRVARDKRTNQIRAIDDLSLEVPTGAVFGFLGPNGAGKTTTIRLLLGLLRPTSGQAEVVGYDARTQADRVRAHTGALLEHTGLYEQLSAQDNLEFYARAWRLTANDRRTRIQELLAHIGLWERRDELVGKWSRGMKQKLALARAMLHRPSLLLLDEPTAGLDVASAVAVREELVALAQREQVTVFVTTHNMAEAETICSQVAVIRQGRLVTVGHPDELRARAAGPRVEVYGDGFSEPILALLRARPEVAAARLQNAHLSIDLNQEASLAPLIHLMVEAGAQVEEVRRDKASLEEVFLALTEEER